MGIDTTLRLLTKATGLTVADLATAIPKAGASTVSAWLKGDKVPGRDQIDALARTFGVPAGALLGELSDYPWPGGAAMVTRRSAPGPVWRRCWRCSPRRVRR